MFSCTRRGTITVAIAFITDFALSEWPNRGLGDEAGTHASATISRVLPEIWALELNTWDRRSTQGRVNEHARGLSLEMS